MYAFLVRDDRGAGAADWVALSAGVIVLGLVVVYMVMGDSHVYLNHALQDLNQDVNEDRAQGDASVATLGNRADPNR